MRLGDERGTLRSARITSRLESNLLSTLELARQAHGRYSGADLGRGGFGRVDGLQEAEGVSGESAASQVCGVEQR